MSFEILSRVTDSSLFSYLQSFYIKQYGDPSSSVHKVVTLKDTPGSVKPALKESMAGRLLKWG
ncbi:hypothetical protein CVT26_004495 [Gymnopilus dilepis]|uniref:Uncharacterized protein n=1 Tax=Gymnopilus dilepis TaxID=231916 RepID=A0A409X9B4_9AGAR|nr:hypothetical protein CVT26_004495 [Gymnopilus dilepis]